MRKKTWIFKEYCYWLILMVIALLFSLNLCENKSEISENPKKEIRKLEKIEQKKEKEIMIYKKIRKEKNPKKIALKNEVLEAKNEKDTVKIVEKQDSLIEFLELDIISLERIVESQDTLITTLRQIKFKEWEMKNQTKKDLKKAKRQRNIAILVGIIGVVTTVILVK